MHCISPACICLRLCVSCTAQYFLRDLLCEHLRRHVEAELLPELHLYLPRRIRDGRADCRLAILSRGLLLALLRHLRRHLRGVDEEVVDILKADFLDDSLCEIVPLLWP